MRRFLLVAPIIVFGTGCVIIAIGVYLAGSSPIQPGQVLFPFQQSVENLSISIIGNPIERVNYTFELLEQRAGSLETLKGSADEIAALRAFSHALAQAEAALAALPEIQKNNFQGIFAHILSQAITTLNTLDYSRQYTYDTYSSVLNRATVLAALANEVKGIEAKTISQDIWSIHLPFISKSGGDSPQTLSGTAGFNPQMVVFPPGSPGAEHAFFPLTGKHAVIECTNCHVEGKFSGTSQLCSSCHEDVKPVNHFTGECSACHSSSTWKPANFNHTGQIKCQSCHLVNKPANHYSGQCSACHNTNAWTPANFNHTGQTNCQSCHLSNRPTNHYSGQCSNCHNTNAWRPASFNHSGQTNCQSCHNRPNGHYAGQCSACHTTNAWRPANFNHGSQTDCQSCHNRPNGHYAGQCSACHSTNAWRPASFNHNGQTDCQSCHNRPNGHYAGQCSACHSTSAWEPASFSHNGQTDCQSCHNRPNGHYAGQCSACHSTNAWRPANFNHSGQTDCQSCHSRPNNHWSGQCSQCHNTNSWGNVQVSGHTFPINHKNANGVCSRCHNSNTPAYTCYNCHNRAETENHHAEKNIFDIANRCADCHPNGEED